MTRKDIDTYFAHLTQKYQSGEWDIALNKDRAHNVMVMRLMLNTSSRVSMYCGEMSIFRDKFYEHITESNKQDDDSLGEYLKEKMVVAMNDFLSKEGACLRIILENGLDKRMDDLIFGDEFKQGISEGKIQIYRLNDTMLFKGDLSHFALSDQIIRMEKDSKEHSAICAIHPKADLLSNMSNHFDTLLNMSTSLAS
jgi:hypothetical protein